MASEYQAFLLRLERSQGQPHWRASLEDAQTGEVLRFANERAMLLHLLRALDVTVLSGGTTSVPETEA